MNMDLDAATKEAPILTLDPFAEAKAEIVEKKPEELADFLAHGTFKGLNVTIPYKKAVIPFCRTLTDQARRIGSVNTVPETQYTRSGSNRFGEVHDVGDTLQEMTCEMQPAFSFTIDALDRHTSRQNALFQAFAEVAERVIPLHAVIDARQTVLGIRRVHAHEPAFRELQRHDATFIVEVRKPQAVKHLQRSPLAENCRSRIAFSVGVTPKLQVIRQVGSSLVRL